MPDPDEGTGTQSPPPPPAPTGKTFSQEDLNDFIGRARNEGRQSSQRDILEALGVKDVSEAKDLISRLKDIDEKNKDELTKAADKATKAQTDLDALQGQHTTTVLQNRVEFSILRKLLGEQAGMLDRTALIRKLVEVDAKAEDKDIDRAVDDLAKTMPELFSVNGAGQGGDGQSGKPAAKPAPAPGRPAPGGGSGPASPADAARTRLHERHPRLTTKTN